MSIISVKLQAVHARIDAAVQQYGRLPGSVSLLAVSKTCSVQQVEEAVAAGQQAFGENYAQEGLGKALALAPSGLTWHFIGPVQSNKSRKISETFDWVHSVDRLKIAERLAAQRPTTLAPLQVCLQVNLDDEESKAGVSLSEVSTVARQIVQLPRLRLRGLMAIPAPCHDFSQQRQRFRLLHEAYEALKYAGLPLDTLSMGMTNDLEAAIAEGATLVRVGSAIFGERKSL